MQTLPSYYSLTMTMQITESRYNDESKGFEAAREWGVSLYVSSELKTSSQLEVNPIRRIVRNSIHGQDEFMSSCQSCCWGHKNNKKIRFRLSSGWNMISDWLKIGVWNFWSGLHWKLLVGGLLAESAIIVSSSNRAFQHGFASSCHRCRTSITFSLWSLRAAGEKILDSTAWI